jgi:formylglycine-generating enzyme required for sulfatase activity
MWVMLPNELRRAANLSWLALLACSGPAFHLVSGDQGGSSGDGGLPGLVETSKPPGDGGAAGESPSSSNPAGGSGSMMSSNGDSGSGSGGSAAGSGAGDASTTPDASTPARSTTCGNPRANAAELADGEVCIEAGTFSMGNAANPSPGYAVQGPVHMVTLSAYFLDMYEVTVARYRQCVGAGNCQPPASTDPNQGCTYTANAGAQELYPVTCVTWQAASNFCTWDQRRLPTEAEWERAGRSGDPSYKYPWGLSPGCDYAVVGGGGSPPPCPNNAGQLPKPVGSALAGVSEDGVYDLSGNAAEWVNDWFGAYAGAAVTDPTGPGSGTQRVQRGGGWRTPSSDASGYARQTADPNATGPFSFRCARDAEP